MPMMLTNNKLGLAIGAIGALTAYFNSPEIADSVTRLVVAVATGATTTVTGDIGFNLGMHAAEKSGVLDAWSHPGIQRTGILGVLAFTAAALWGGYEAGRVGFTHIALGQQPHTAPAPVQAAPKVSLRELENNGFRFTV